MAAILVIKLLVASDIGIEMTGLPIGDQYSPSPSESLSTQILAIKSSNPIRKKRAFLI
jgi:hypothetical protein